MTIALFPAVSHSGIAGLRAAGRGETWSGPALQLKETLKAGAVYDVSAWVRLDSAAGPPSTVKLTMEEKKPSGGTNWKTVSEAKVADAAWVQLKGSYSFSGSMESLVLYAETSNTSDNICLDDVIFEMTVAAPTAPPVAV